MIRYKAEEYNKIIEIIKWSSTVVTEKIWTVTEKIWTPTINYMKIKK